MECPSSPTSDRGGVCDRQINLSDVRPQANSRSFSTRGVDLFQPRAVISASARGLAWIRLFFVVDGPIRGSD